MILLCCMRWGFESISFKPYKFNFHSLTPNPHRTPDRLFLHSSLTKFQTVLFKFVLTKNIVTLFFSFLFRCRWVEVHKQRLKFLLASLQLSLHCTSTSWDVCSSLAMIGSCENPGRQYKVLATFRAFSWRSYKAALLHNVLRTLIVIGFHRLSNIHSVMQYGRLIFRFSVALNHFGPSSVLQTIRSSDKCSYAESRS